MTTTHISLSIRSRSLPGPSSPLRSCTSGAAPVPGPRSLRPSRARKGEGCVRFGGQVLTLTRDCDSNAMGIWVQAPIREPEFNPSPTSRQRANLKIKHAGLLTQPLAFRYKLCQPPPQKKYRKHKQEMSLPDPKKNLRRAPLKGSLTETKEKNNL